MSRSKYIKEILRDNFCFLIIIILVEVVTYAGSFLLSGIFKRDVFSILFDENTILGIRNIKLLIFMDMLVPLSINIIKQVNSAFVTKLRMRIMNAARIRLYNSYFKFEGDIMSGKIIDLYRNDCADITDYILEYYYQIPKIILGMSILFMMCSINFVFTLISIFPVICVVFLMKKMERKIWKYRENLREATGKLTGLMNNIFENYEYFVIETKINILKDLYKNKCKERASKAIKDSMLQNIITIVSEKLELFAMGIIMIVSIPFFVNGEIQVGDFVMFEYYFWFLSYLPESISILMQGYHQSQVAVQRLISIEEREQTDFCDKELVQGRSENYLIQDIKQNMLSQNVFSLKIDKKGLKFLLQEKMKDENKKIEWVLEDPILFSGTVEENILWGNEKNQRKFYEAIKDAELIRDIKNWDDKELKMVGEVGSAISGGQRKRIALARALYDDPEIIFIYQLNSGLDEKTFRTIVSNLKEVKNTISVLLYESEDEKTLYESCLAGE